MCTFYVYETSTFIVKDVILARTMEAAYELIGKAKGVDITDMPVFVHLI